MIKKNKVFTVKNVCKLLWIMYAVFSMTYWIPKIDSMFAKEYEEVSQYVSLNDGWDITINDASYSNVSLDKLNFDPVSKGDIIVMQRILPDDWGNIVEGSLRLHIRQTSVNMYIDNTLVYEYGSERVEQNKTVGSGLQFVGFPNEYRGKIIKLEMSVAEDAVFTKFDEIRIYEWENAYRALMTENRHPLFFGSFLLVFGLAILIITTFAVLLSRKYVRIFCIAAFSICMGLWTMAYYNVLIIFSIPLYSVSLMEYMTLYLAPLPLIIYMYENVKNLRQKGITIVYWILFSVQLLFDVIILTLHTMDVIHCAAVLTLFQILVIINLLYFTFVLILSIRNSGKVNRYYLFGMSFIVICTAYDLVNYYLNRYVGHSPLTIRGVSCIGVMVFIFILIYTFYVNLSEKMMEETERTALIKSAYTDELTQMSNRRYCSEYMKKIEDDGNLGYAVVCFDLNNLKVTNDTYGHAKGDLLIKSAAEVIAKSFNDCGAVGRMGGDEFIAILTESRKDVVDGLIDNFLSNIDKKNEEVEDLNLSISYGYALCDESEERNIEKIYQIADDRMYQNKKQYKESLAALF